ncbi:SHOCT domain-containing protein [Rhodococcus erythropolis]|uniref:SHOCT domain-containing protein n=1 Tax=Rhodococcus erythropolis TaxID=1833 RepID=UPI001E4A77C0|nr:MULTISPECIES: SHOCT domain-containing protein [Rhodococcus erythropolis group]MCD2104611.1 SHOCT domain-containing protein [Rhodococcus qingshengii]MCZ4525263.1 SHOCT domain-containing protein [Rhodococcus erythropolis]
MMWWNDGAGYGMGWGVWVLMGIAMIIFWGVVVVGVLALFRQSRTNRTPAERSPQEVLDGRFARGEIDAEEYRARKAILGPGREHRSA